jgi:hypothetical protein
MPATPSVNVICHLAYSSTGTAGAREGVSHHGETDSVASDRNPTRGCGDAEAFEIHRKILGTISATEFDGLARAVDTGSIVDLGKLARELSRT